MGSNNPEMHEAIEKLLSANDELVRAKSSADSARAHETNCINAVNQAQKELDMLVATLKKEAARDTGWGAQRGIKPAHAA